MREREKELHAEIERIAAEITRLATAESVVREMSGDIDLPKSFKVVKAFQVLRRETKRDQILKGALEFLEFGPLQTEEILSRLIANGVDIAGEDQQAKMSNVSSYLSKARKEIGIEHTKSGWAKKAFMQALHEHQAQPRE